MSLAVSGIPGVSQNYHNLSHHGEAPQKLKELAIVEAEYLKLYGDFLLKPKAIRICWTARWCCWRRAKKLGRTRSRTQHCSCGRTTSDISAT